MNTFIKWCNTNSGFLNLAIFITTLLLGWISGFFKALLNKPDLRIERLNGPSFSSTNPTGRRHNGYPTHITAVSIYLKITNIGSIPTNIEEIDIGYRAKYKWFTKSWFKYALRRIYLRNVIFDTGEFHIKFKNGEKYSYPSLFYKEKEQGITRGPYLTVGQSAKGVVYFEQVESFGGHLPLCFNNLISFKLKIRDSFKRVYVKQFFVNNVGIEFARSFFPKFGQAIDFSEAEVAENNPYDPALFHQEK